MKYRRLTEKNGQSQCQGCKELGIWYVSWTSFMYEIEGREGHYCWGCLRGLEAQERKEEYERSKSLCKAEMKGD